MSGYWGKSDSASTRINPEISAGPSTDFYENFSAARQDQKFNSNPMSMYNNLTGAYQERVVEVYKATGKQLENPILAVMPSLVKDTIVPGGTEFFRQSQIDAFEAEVEKMREQFPDLRTRDQMMESLSGRAAEIEGAAQDIGDRSTLMGSIGGIVGMIEGAVEDPAILVTLPLGAARGASILKTAIVEGGIAAGTEAVVQPQVQNWRDEKGLEAGLAQGAENVAAAGFGGAVLGGTIKGLETMFGRKLINQFDSSVKNPTPEQKSARDLYERVVEVNESSPLDSAVPDSIPEHNDRLAQAMRSLEEGQAVDLPMPESPLSKKMLNAGPDNLDGVIYGFRPDDIEVDAKTFQFKDGGDAAGVTERLRGVSDWDPVKAGNVLVYEYADGRRFVADGHQRLGLAKRLQATRPDEKITVYGQLFREDDGYSPEMVRVVAAMKNIAEGTGTAVDAAKVLRVSPDRIAELPPRSALVRQASDMMDLSDDVFGMVINDVVDANYAAIVGRLVKEPDMQRAVMDVLAKTEPANVVQAESIVRQAMESGTKSETQFGLFGEETITSSLFLERAKVLDKALKKLRQDAKVFDTLIRNEDSIAREGNVLSRSANEARAAIDARAAHMIQTLANRKGALSDALTNAGRRAANDGKYTGATDDFIAAVRSAIERGDFDGLPSGGDGRGIETATQGAARSSQPTEGLDDQSLNLFDQPGGTGSEQQARALDSDLRREVANSSTDSQDILDMAIPVGERVDPDTGRNIPETKTIGEILDELDQDAADLDAIGKCGRP